jgi:uncharacterized lipoprotein YddW (UPF0748 family)
VHRRVIGLCVLAAQIVATPLPSGGAFAFQPPYRDDSPAAVPYLTRLLATTPIQPANEIRALWVVRDALRSVDTIDRMIDFAVQARFHLLFVQVRGRGEAYYRSSIEPTATDLELPIDDFDPLEYLLIRARRAGISVHAWVNVFYVWSDPDNEPPPGHVVREHPEWLLSSPTGERQDAHNVRRWQRDGIEGYYLSPAVPAVRAYTASVVADLVSRYPLDGVHLDYVRYPGRGFTFGPEVRTHFALAWGVDPLAVGSLAETLGGDFTALVDSVYTAWRVAQVDSTVAALREAAGGIPVSAAVVADDMRGRVEKGQDWVGWLQSGLVDFVVPMAYADPPAGIERRVRYYNNAVGRERVLVGLALYDGRHEQLAESVSRLREEHAMGFSLFSYNVMADYPYAARFIEESIFETLPPDSLDGGGDPWEDEEAP